MLLLFVLMVGQSALADSFRVSDFELTPTSGPNDPGSPQQCVIDGPGAVANDGRTFGPSDQLSIDRSCTVKNFTCDNPLGSTLNFASHVEGTLIVFDNVCYDGNFACANVDGSAYVWAVNGSDFSSVRPGCQDLIIPVEKIEKSATDLEGNPISSVSVGVPFRYTLDIPVLFDPVSGTVIQDYGSLNELGNIVITDDMTPGTMGVDLELLNISASYGPAGNPTATPMTEGTDYTVVSSEGNPSTPGELTFTIHSPDPLPADYQIHIDIDVMLRPGSALNNVGKSFINVAEWEFSRFIDGILYDPLPGENGVAQLLSISQPDLVMNKSTSATAVNFSDMPEYTLSVQNVGGAPAWNIVIEDLLPVGMREFDPTNEPITVTLAGATLAEGADYTVAYNPGPGANGGLLTIELQDQAGGLAHNELLEVTYSSKIDQPGSANEPANGDVLTNVAAATYWRNDATNNSNAAEFSGTLSDGTVGTDDEQDAASITVALSGYYFEKTVENLTTGAYPAVTAAPGDDLRYIIRLFNVDQNIDAIQITDDQLDTEHFSAGPTQVYCAIDGDEPVTVNPVCDFTGGVVTVTGEGGAALALPIGSDLIVQFDVTLGAAVADGTVLSNQAFLEATGITSVDPPPPNYPSNDPFVNGVADPEVIGDEVPTIVTVAAPGPLSKTAATTTAAIGEIIEYTITVPATPVSARLYDVHILDSLPTHVDLEFIEATATVGATTHTLVNTGSATDLVLQDTQTGLEIPAGEQANVTLQVQVANTPQNQDGVSFTNTAAYTYSRTRGGVQSDPAGTQATSSQVTIVEPLPVAFTKTVANVTPGKAATDPAHGGDTLEYVISLTNNGNSTAYDANLVDLLPPELVLTGTPSATLDGNPVPGFVSSPTEPGDGSLIWGRTNGDGSLDIPAGSELLLTYQVTVQTVSGGDLENAATADWTSLDGAQPGQRSGNDAPDHNGLNNYFAGPAVATLASEDTNAFSKSVLVDSWDDAHSSADDGVLRVGDTVVYRLALTLREGLTADVQVSDTLPEGLAFDGTLNINGATAAPYSAVAPFSHADIEAPLVDASSNTVVWHLGDIDNAINNDSSDDTFVIEYRARVLTDILEHTASTTLTNTASVSYDSDAVLNDSASIEVRQPVLVTVSKTDEAGNSYPDSSEPLAVDIANDIIQFNLEACNDSGSTAPAYSLKLVDTLATELDETSITTPQVTVNGVLQAEGSSYTYTPPASRGGEMVFDLETAVQPGQCAQVAYSIGFHPDVAPNQLWNNSVSAAEYWSLPDADGQRYPAVGPASFWMSNPSQDPIPVKTLLSPDAEATIGEQVVYEILIPAINAARTNVLISDTLPEQLVYREASATVAGSPVALTDNSTPPTQVSLLIAEIPAGQQALIRLTTEVANTATSNAGDTFTNTVSYQYDGYDGPTLSSDPSAPVTVVEPQVTVVKGVSPTDPPVAGDILSYSVALTASEGALYSSAFDLELVDTLSLGLEYLPGSATLDGVPLEPTVVGDGVNTAQTLTWSDIDVAEGATATLAYDVRVRNEVTPGQNLSNLATARWTSLSGDHPGQRDGSEEPAHNDYVASDSTSLGAPDLTSLNKARVTDTFDADTDTLRVGDRVDFELRVGLQEGTHNDLVLTDQLPVGLIFEAVVSVDFFGTPGSAEPTTVSSDGRTISWELGTVTNPADGDSSNNDLVIVYQARVENDSTLAQTPTTQLLANQAELHYTVGGVEALPKTDSATVTVLQPLLEVSKQGSPASAGSEVVAGETVNYTVEISNTGTAPAYDMVLSDTLPEGMRQTGGPTTTAVTLVNAGTSLPLLAADYDAASGVAIWDFNQGGADTYTVPVGETLRLEYQVVADADLGPERTLTNLAQILRYFSFDDDAVPAGGQVDERQQYGPSNSDAVTLFSPGAGALSKAITQPEAAIGEPFHYLLSVPAVPVETALSGVQVLDNLTDSAAALIFLDARYSLDGGDSWAPMSNLGSAQDLLLVDQVSGEGLDIPANAQALVEISVALADEPVNQPGLTFRNTASYRYDGFSGDSADLAGSSEQMVVVGPDLVLTKGGPESMSFGTPGNFVIDIQNTGTATAWDITLTDLLPNLDSGGMCDAAPQLTQVAIYQADGSTQLAVLAENTDFTTAFQSGSPCTLSLIGQGAGAALLPGQILRVEYQASLDENTPANIELTNYAGATEWFSQDADTDNRRRYSHSLEETKENDPDPQDYHTITTNPPDMVVEKTVQLHNDVDSTGQANPGDTLRYTITVTNTSSVLLPNFSVRDDLGGLHPDVRVFAPGSLQLVSAPAGASDLSDPNGGTQGSGLLEVEGLSLGAAGSGQERVTLVFDVTLASVIDNGKVVLNQGEVHYLGSVLQRTDDPSLPGDEDPTPITVHSAVQMQVEKVSEILSGDSNVLMPGETLRYTLTVRNIGNENAVNVTLRDAVPEYTTYLPGSTTLNGVAVADADGGRSPLADGILIHAPGNNTAGVMEAQAANNLATIRFSVVVKEDTLEGTRIVNQGFVNGRGAGGDELMEQPSDDPRTEAVNDPTVDIVGGLPLLIVHKTVALHEDLNDNSAPDPGDTLRYRFVISNTADLPATGLLLSDQIPDNTSYIANSTTLDGVGLADQGGTSPLVSGIEIGELEGNRDAVVTFDVRINEGVPDGTLISNQGLLVSNELPDEPSDADGNPANGHQPTEIITGQSQQLAIVKSVTVVDGGPVQPGAQLEYTVQASNNGLVPATQVVLRDDLSGLSGLASYVDGSARLNGGRSGVDDSGTVLLADYAGSFGDLPVGANATLRFRVLLAEDLPAGTVISNTGEVTWNTPSQSATDTVAVTTGAIPGTATLSGRVWHDSDFDLEYGAGEQSLAGWEVELWRNGSHLRTQRTDEQGQYRHQGLPRTQADEHYELRFRAPGANASTAMLGWADSAFTNSLQRITDITAGPDALVAELNLPITPNGVVYNSISREPVAGATLTMVNSGGAALARSCFADPAQQGQLTPASGFYKFDLNLDDPACRSADYLIEVEVPGEGNFEEGVSQIIVPATDAETAAYDVPSCFDDAVAATDHCEAQPSAYPQPPAVTADSPLNRYYLRLAFANGSVPEDSQIFNNHIPLDPVLAGAVTISKTASVVNVSRGQFVPYVIQVKNGYDLALPNLMIADNFPPGFKYVEGSARLDDEPVELLAQGRQVVLPNLTLEPNQQHTLKLLFIVGSGVGEGEYVNRAQVLQALAARSSADNQRAVSGEASAAVRVVPDPDFDCTDVIGKVFDDRNLNGYQDDGEPGLPGVRLVTARGLQITTDAYGRFHLTCAMVPDENRGGNFILKVDDRSLPSGYRITTENPLVRRATRGKMIKFNFGAALHRVVALDLANDVFEPGGTTLRSQWQSRLPLLMAELETEESVLRLAYMAEIESRRLVERRLRAIKRLIGDQWQALGNPYELTVETEVFWRTGAPPARRGK